MLSNRKHFCSSDHVCPSGYKNLPGDIKNATIKGEIPATIEECATLCDDTKDCMSFKHGYDNKFHSYYNKKELCYLNTEKEADKKSLDHPHFTLCIENSKGKVLVFI